MHVRVKPEKGFYRDGVDLYTSSEINFSQAVLGDKIQVETDQHIKEAEHKILEEQKQFVQDLYAGYDEKIRKLNDSMKNQRIFIHEKIKYKIIYFLILINFYLIKKINSLFNFILV